MHRRRNEGFSAEFAVDTLTPEQKLREKNVSQPAQCCIRLYSDAPAGALQRWREKKKKKNINTRPSSISNQRALVSLSVLRARFSASTYPFPRHPVCVCWHHQRWHHSYIEYTSKSPFVAAGTFDQSGACAPRRASWLVCYAVAWSGIRQPGISRRCTTAAETQITAVRVLPL